MSRWVPIAKVAECPPSAALERLVEDRIVALFNVEGRFFALDGVCPHQGGPLGQGCLTGHTVTCPWHGWQFDVRTGRHLLSPTIAQPSIPVRVDGDDVLVEIE